MKKISSKLFFLLTIFLTISIFFSTPVFAVNSASSAEEQISFFINIYDEESGEFLLPNTEITVPVGTTVSTSMEILKQNGLITDYRRGESEINSITFVDGSVITVSPPPDTKLIYIKHNGTPEFTDEATSVIQDGDIVEWIYGPPLKNVVLPTESENGEGSIANANGRIDAIEWKDEYQTALSDSCEFLNLNKETETAYLVAMGTANKTLDVKIINNLLSKIRRTKSYENLQELAKTVLSLTFAGYDASELVKELSAYESAAEMTIEDAIYTLFAYDCYNYEVSPEALNSRQHLIDVIASFQAENGGFKKSSISSSSVTMSAMAIAAISPYSDTAKIQEMINKAVGYLAEVQNKDGTFNENGKESCLALSKVIIGLTASNVSIEDERFLKDDKNLIDVLFEFQNIDGGFTEVRDGKSIVSLTEQAVIALATIKKNDYPYLVTQKLSQLKKAVTDELTVGAEEISDYVLFCGIVAIAVCMTAVAVSFILKYKSRRGQIY